MKVVIQRVKSSKVEVNNKIIGHGGAPGYNIIINVLIIILKL